MGQSQRAAESAGPFAWTFGYISDVPYTVGFHRELAPSFLDCVCLFSRVRGLPQGRPLRYCELGCGRGFGTTLLAASNPDIDFVGIDFNPSHIAEARELARHAAVGNVEFLEIGFGDAARSSDPRLAKFDIVVLHGVYTWVPHTVRGEIHDFLRARLAIGGIAYVSYNALPGSASAIPTQRLLLEVGKRAAGDSLARIERGLEVLKLFANDAESRYAGLDRAANEAVRRLAQRDRHYLAHEYLNAAWEPLFVTDAFAALAQAQLAYVGSAQIGDNRVELCVPRGLQDLVRSTPEAAMRELLKDFSTGKQFRRDVYVKGPRPLSPAEHGQALRVATFALCSSAIRSPEKIRVPVGDVTLDKQVLRAVWDVLQEGPATGAKLVRAANKAGDRSGLVWAIVELLVHADLIGPARPSSASTSRAESRKLNQVIMKMAESSDTHRFLASPVLGSAIFSTLPERIVAQLLLEDPEADDRTIAAAAFNRIADSGQKFLSDGRPVEMSEKSVRAMARSVAEFRSHRLPRWRQLKVID